MALGRPTSYKEEYCQMLIDHMAQGLSFRSFAGLIGVHFDTLYEWVKVHPSFSDAKKIGLPKGLLTYEKTIWAATHGKIPNFNNTAAVWFGKNVYSWADKKELDVTSNGNSIGITIDDNDSEL